MLTKTSISAIRTATFLGLHGDGDPVSPRSMAEQLGESPTYLAKVVRHLVKAGILCAHRGVAGGVTLNHPPDEITLLAIIEACQGAILGDFCRGDVPKSKLKKTCALHQAGVELHEAIVGVLSRWTLARLLRKPRPSPGLLDGRTECLLDPIPQQISARSRSRSGTSTNRK